MQTSNSLLKDIEYENGANEKRALSVCWHRDFGLFNISFYRNAENDLIFAEDFDLPTATELRNQLSALIEAATEDIAFAQAGKLGHSKSKHY